MTLKLMGQCNTDMTMSAGHAGLSNHWSVVLSEYIQVKTVIVLILISMTTRAAFGC